MSESFNNLCIYYLNELKVINYYDFLIHSSNLSAKIRNTIKNFKNNSENAVFKNEQDLTLFINTYLDYRIKVDEALNSILLLDKYEFENVQVNLDIMINEFRKYKNKTSILNKNDAYFASPTKYESTILEEFMGLFLYPLTQIYKDDKYKCGPVKAYCEMNMKGNEIEIKVKDQDFAIYQDIPVAEKVIHKPLISIECKTYIDKTMYEGSVSTAKRIRQGNPESFFFVVAEESDLSSNNDCEDIDNIFFLRKSKRKKGKSKTDKKPICNDVFHDIYQECFYIISLKSKETDIDHKVTVDGRMKPCNYMRY